jgi:hypothetical protein
MVSFLWKKKKKSRVPIYLYCLDAEEGLKQTIQIRTSATTTRDAGQRAQRQRSRGIKEED